MPELPSFDELRDLAARDPQALSRLRQNACQEFIDSIPVANRPRMRAVQFRVDTELRRAKNPMAGLMSVSRMMYDSLIKMGESIEALTRPAERLPPQRPLADVIDLRAWRKQRRRH